MTDSLSYHKGSSEGSCCQGKYYLASVHGATVQSYLEDPLVAQQQIGRLQIAMEDPVVVEMSDTSQQLDHESLHFTWERNVVLKLIFIPFNFLVQACSSVSLYLAGRAASWFPSDSSGHVLHSSSRCRSCPYYFQQLFPNIGGKAKFRVSWTLKDTQ